MTAEPHGDAQVEIGHIVFMDVVGFSKLLGDEQNELSQRLNQIVRNTESFRAADASGRLIRLPTGDGMALVFFSGPEAPVQCAVEIGRALKSSIALRMGIHSGPVNKAIDVDGRANVTGGGINMAQRLMDCGDAGHILLSKRIAEDLAHYGKWRPHLHELGQAEVKHGAKIDIVNFYTDEIGNRATPQRLKERPTTTRARSKKILIAAGLLVAIALAAGVWLVVSRSQEKQATLAGAVPEKSIAIFPFKPLASQNRDEILENGMADTLIAKLSAIHGLIIPALTSARKYDEQERDPLAAGRLLRVHSVLEGTLQKLGDRIRVTARLVNVADGASLWTQTFDEKFTDVFEVQDTIARKVAAALALQLSGEEQNRLTKRDTANTEAYQLYLKGRFYWAKYTEEGLRKSIECFKDAIAKDPNYALAYTGLADTFSLLGELGYGDPTETFEQARSYAQKSIALDDSLADAHLSLGIVKLFYDWNLPEAQKELQRAKRLNPNNAQVYHFYGHYLELSNRMEEAIAETKRGVDLDPTSLVLNNELGTAYAWARKYDLALAQYRKTLEMDPGFAFASFQIAVTYDTIGRFEDALAALDKLRSQAADDPGFLSELAYVDAKLGKTAEARTIVEQLQQRAAREYIDQVSVALIYIALGDKEQALSALEAGYRQHSTGCPWLKIDPRYDPLRSEPRFIDLVRRIGL